jgi:glycolate dehydrogenase FAD-binding subunit
MIKASTNLAARLESLLGAPHIAADPATCADFAVDEIIPTAIAKPASAEEVAEIVRFAALEKLALIPCGNRTKLGMGMPPSRYDIAIDMTALNHIAHYDPGDLTLSVGAGANFNDCAVPLYNQKQFLPLSVPFYFESTIGGIIASGVDSSLRHSYGTARDFLIGAEFVDGTGKLCKSGGRVVKNVTGYDLHKLLIGSLGTLAVITRLNFRTFPAAPASRGFVASFRAAEDALLLRRLVADSPLAPASLELLSPQLMQHLLDAAKNAEDPAGTSLEGKVPVNSWHLCVSVEGPGEVCDRSARDLARLAGQPATKNIQSIILSENDGADLWHYIGQAVPVLLESSPAAAIFKIAQLPSRLGPLLHQLSAIARQLSLAHAVMARGCGVVYFALLPQMSNAAPLQDLASEADTLSRLTTAASAIFQLCARETASATLPWCPTALKHGLRVPAVSAGHRLKSAFDPHNIFAPGRAI